MMTCFRLFSPSYGAFFNLIILPHWIIIFTAFFTALSYGLVGIVGFGCLAALIFYGMPVREGRFGGLFSVSIMSSLIIAFYIGLKSIFGYPKEDVLLYSLVTCCTALGVLSIYKIETVE